MLVLSRNLNQEIVIGRDGAAEIVIRVLNINSERQVRIGIEASENYTIHRREIFEQIERDKINGIPPKKRKKLEITGNIE